MRLTEMKALLVLGVVALAAGTVASADEPVDSTGEAPCAERVALQVQTRYESVRDFRAAFEQSTERVGFSGEVPDALRAAGEVFLQKPGRMRWAYTKPAPSFVISDGEGAWVYDPVAAEAQYFELGSEFLSGAALQFLLGEGRLLDAFEVRSEGCHDADDVILELTPREPASFERLDLVVDPKTGDVTETRIVDLLGNRTRLVLRDVRFGEAPAPGLFEFEAPPGTKVLSLPGGATP
jgi:outer membrane lipoprotein-sorting protein